MTRLITVCAAALLLIGSSSAFGRGSGGSHSGTHSYSSSRSYGYTNPSDHYVHPYATKNGTYVHGHMQTNPNHTKSDNFSTRGNANPYTGKPGTKSPE
jgi:hypothetical protein